MHSNLFESTLSDKNNVMKLISFSFSQNRFCAFFVSMKLILKHFEHSTITLLTTLQCCIDLSMEREWEESSHQVYVSTTMLNHFENIP